MSRWKLIASLLLAALPAPPPSAIQAQSVVGTPSTSDTPRNLREPLSFDHATARRLAERLIPVIADQVEDASRKPILGIPGGFFGFRFIFRLRPVAVSNDFCRARNVWVEYKFDPRLFREPMELPDVPGTPTGAPGGEWRFDEILQADRFLPPHPQQDMADEQKVCAALSLDAGWTPAPDENEVRAARYWWRETRKALTARPAPELACIRYGKTGCPTSLALLRRILSRQPDEVRQLDTIDGASVAELNYHQPEGVDSLSVILRETHDAPASITIVYGPPIVAPVA